MCQQKLYNYTFDTYRASNDIRFFRCANDHVVTENQVEVIEGTMYCPKCGNDEIILVEV